ncbi:MAG: hypothetical protein KR126chlam4_00483 [Candidatus Anoxychlamydiales bacterium]|nr:hypothetical protein [Candidatus Anoxychlamydiales bacterium]
MDLKEKFSSLEKKPKSLSKKSEDLDKNKNLLVKNISKKDQRFSPKIKNFEKFTLFFRLKGLIYLLKQDKKSKLLKFFIKRPFYHSFNLIKSYIQKKPYIKEEKELFLFNLKSFNDFKNRLTNKNTLLVLGFSYCMKPKECPEKRFSPDCRHDLNHPVCQTCFIGKCINSMSKEDIFLVIPDVYYISEKLTQIKKQNPEKEILFVIITCNLSIHMFSDNANMIKMKGLAIELSGRICVNNKTFMLAEKGIKPGITYLSYKNEDMVFELLSIRSKVFT